MKPVNINTNTNTNTNTDNQKENIETNNSDKQINLSNEFDKIESINKLNSDKIRPQFDFYKDFEMRENIEKTVDQNNSSQDINEINMLLNSFPIINDNIRTNIQLI